MYTLGVLFTAGSSIGFEGYLIQRIYDTYTTKAITISTINVPEYYIIIFFFHMDNDLN